MTPLIFNLGPSELLIILAIVLLLFGGSRLAGLGKSTGRALKEFKEETKGLKAGETAPPAAGAAGQNPYAADSGPAQIPPAGAPYVAPPQSGTPYVQPQQDAAYQPYEAPQAGGSSPVNGAHPQGQPTEHDARRDV